MNFLERIGEKILDCVLAALGRNLDYLIHYKSNVDNLVPQVIYLPDAKDSIQNEVAAARRNVMEIHPNVQTWLTRSDGIIAEAEEFFRNNGQAKMTCCNGWCPNLKSRYRVNKRAYMMRLEVEEINGKGNFNGVGYHEPTQVVGTATSNTGYEAFESRMQTLTGVLKALKDPKINRIGVYGMGGVGKTMLAKVVKQAQKDQLFDKYLFLVVSKDPVLKNYEFLKSNEAKSLWLLCSLHREDYNIEVEDLLKYGVGLSLFGNLDKIEDARCRVHTLVKKLKDSSFLLEGDYYGTVKMHDVIRDVAINIASEQRQMFMIRNTTDLQESLNCKDSFAISLPYIDDCDIPKSFECPNLHLFFMFDQKETLQIPISFFEGLKELRVLSLSQIWFEMLPSSLLSLEKLQTLNLDALQNAGALGRVFKAVAIKNAAQDRLKSRFIKNGT